MASLEDLMAGLFGGNLAPGAMDERRRRGGPGQGGYGGIGGAGVSPGQLLPYYTGMPVYDYSGPMGSQFAGRGGLMSMLAEAGGGRDVQGPALRHFANQGFDFMPPGLDNREGPGGPNIAPGNLDGGQAIDQPQGNQTPGVPQGVARGQAPGEVRPMPHTQGWRNVAPGYSAAAQYGFGTPEFGRHFQEGQPLPAGATGGSGPGIGGFKGGYEGPLPGGLRGPGDSGGPPGGGKNAGIRPGGPGVGGSTPPRASEGPGGGGGGGGGRGGGPRRGSGGGGGKGGGKGSQGSSAGAQQLRASSQEPRTPQAPRAPRVNPPNSGNNNTPSETRRVAPAASTSNNTPSETRNITPPPPRQTSRKSGSTRPSARRVAAQGGGRLR